MVDTRRLAEWAEPDTARSPEQLRGQVTEREGLWLRREARRVPADQVIVEIGSYTGKSTCCLAVGSAEGCKVPVHAVDLWELGTSRKGGRFHVYNPEVDGDRSSSKFHHPDVHEKFRRRVLQYDYAKRVREWMGESIEIATRFSLPIGLLFIDAEHTYEAVRADFEAWSPKVVPDGIIAFHDYAMKKEGHSGIKDFVDGLPSYWWEVARIVESIAVVKRRSVGC